MDSGITSETRREYIHVGSTAASMQQTVSPATPESILRECAKP
ncbi:hypothetical protein [Cellvibrio sp. NN19]|nr:hypothetical protein [Cellvibrio sp. NN19]